VMTVLIGEIPSIIPVFGGWVGCQVGGVLLDQLLVVQHGHCCEDSYLRGVQQCHEPAGNYPSTKSTQRRSTRSPCKVTFDQSRPTTIRQDLNNFSA